MKLEAGERYRWTDGVIVRANAHGVVKSCRGSMHTYVHQTLQCLRFACFVHCDNHTHGARDVVRPASPESSE